MIPRCFPSRQIGRHQSQRRQHHNTPTHSWPTTPFTGLSLLSVTRHVCQVLSRNIDDDNREKSFMCGTMYNRPSSSQSPTPPSSNDIWAGAVAAMSGRPPSPPPPNLEVSHPDISNVIVLYVQHLPQLLLRMLSCLEFTALYMC